MVLEGTFTGIRWDEIAYGEVELGGKLAKATIVNRYEGGIEADGALEYLLSYCPGRPVTFYGLERVQTSSGEPGTLVLEHEGTFSLENGVAGTTKVVPGMGTGRFAGFSGSGRISSRPNEHHGTYIFELASDGVE
jgi:hypothetical protein